MDARYTVLDIGYVLNGNVYAIGLSDAYQELYLLQDNLCGTNLTFKTTTVELFPIMRVENYESVTTNTLTSSEKGIVYTTAVLYTLGILMALVLFSARVSIRAGLIVNYVICVHVLLIYIFRAVYFFLLGAGTLPDRNGGRESITDYILIEIPTFFYLGAFSLIALSFLFLYLRAYKEKQLSQKVFWICFLLWTLILWIGFAIVIILMETQGQTSSENQVTRYCANRLVVDFDVQEGMNKKDYFLRK